MPVKIFLVFSFFTNALFKLQLAFVKFSSMEINHYYYIKKIAISDIVLKAISTKAENPPICAVDMHISVNLI